MKADHETIRSLLMSPLKVSGSKRILLIWKANHSFTLESLKPAKWLHACFGFWGFLFPENFFESHGFKESYFERAKASGPCMAGMSWAQNDKPD